MPTQGGEITLGRGGENSGGGADADRWLKVGFVAPALLVLISVNIFPLIYSIWLSFTNADLVGGGIRSVGTLNYSFLFFDPRYAQALRTTVLFVALAVGIELVLGYGLALCLRPTFRGKPILLTALLVPMMMPPAVMGVYWTLILNGSFGVLNQALGLLGLPELQWLTDPDLKLVSIILIDVWMWTPFTILISLAGLNAIPASIYEAAAVDRATTWMVFRRITLPMSAPLVGLAALLRATDALKQFDLVMAITGPNDGATQTLSALLYQVMFRDGKVGLASAYSYMVLVVVIALASVFLRYLASLQHRASATEAT
ncbi:MAG: sugar ABC transporter permease [Candidatus Latescibacterota bacterium]|nr:sugar ABC transporter permease [Candidatus Latescibacterota bacterium]